MLDKEKKVEEDFKLKLNTCSHFQDSLQLKEQEPSMKDLTFIDQIS